MHQLLILSPSQQVAQHLREQLYRGVWSTFMPGAPQLAEEYGIDRKTVDAALKLLEDEGLLIPQGPGKRRKIHLQKKSVTPSLRIAILACDESDRSQDYIVEIYHGLQEQGHHSFYAARYLDELNMDVKSVSRLVKQTDADAWIVLAGSREVLQWFSQQSFPSFALFGRRRGLSLASVGPDKIPPMVEATRTLARLGHSRIVLMVRPRRRLPVPGAPELAFLAELKAQGISTSDYNLPSWDENIEDFHHRLESMFRTAPPTAMIIDEVSQFIAALQFLARHRLRVPQDVSMICTDSSSCFDWCAQEVACIRWDIAPVVRRVLRWASIVSHGKKDLRHTLTPSVFVPGATIGPARKQLDLAW